MARPRKPENEKGETLSSKVPPEIVDRLREIAEQEERSLSQVVKMLLFRGLEAYDSDGLLITGSVDAKTTKTRARQR